MCVCVCVCPWTLLIVYTLCVRERGVSAYVTPDIASQPIGHRNECRLTCQQNTLQSDVSSLSHTQPTIHTHTYIRTHTLITNLSFPFFLLSLNFFSLSLSHSLRLPSSPSWAIVGTKSSTSERRRENIISRGRKRGREGEREREGRERGREREGEG